MSKLTKKSNYYKITLGENIMEEKMRYSKLMNYVRKYLRSRYPEGIYDFIDSVERLDEDSPNPIRITRTISPRTSQESVREKLPVVVCYRMTEVQHNEHYEEHYYPCGERTVIDMSQAKSAFISIPDDVLEGTLGYIYEEKSFDFGRKR